MCYYLGWLQRGEGVSQAEFPKYIWEMDYPCLKAHHPFLESSRGQLPWIFRSHFSPSLYHSLAYWERAKITSTRILQPEIQVYQSGQ